MTWPPTVIVVRRGSLLELAVAEKDTAPLPVPLGVVTVSHAAELVAAHGHEALVLIVTLAPPADAARSMLVVDSV